MKFDAKKSWEDFKKEHRLEDWWSPKEYFDWITEEIDLSDRFPCDQTKPCKNHNIQRINLYLKQE